MKMIRILSVLLIFLWVCRVEADELKIDSGGGISWMPDEKVYLASGRVRILRNETALWSDEAKAHYVDDPEVIVRIELIGRVRIVQGETEIQGDYAEVLPDEELFRLRGSPLYLEHGELRMSAERRLEYRGRERLVQAVGGVLISRGASRLAAREVEARFAANGEGIEEVRLTGDVEGDHGEAGAGDRLYMRGDTALYRVRESWIKLCGQAELLRGDDMIRGECGSYNLDTGEFRILSNNDLEEQPSGSPGDATEGGRTQIILKVK